MTSASNSRRQWRCCAILVVPCGSVLWSQHNAGERPRGTWAIFAAIVVQWRFWFRSCTSTSPLDPSCKYAGRGGTSQPASVHPSPSSRPRTHRWGGRGLLIRAAAHGRLRTAAKEHLSAGVAANFQPSWHEPSSVPQTVNAGNLASTTWSGIQHISLEHSAYYTPTFTSIYIHRRRTAVRICSSFKVPYGTAISYMYIVK